MKRDGETRKVQRVGSSTLTVSLPKEWADRMHLEAGDEVLFERNDDGSLRLAKRGERQEITVTCIIDADRCDPALLERCIVGGYILGYKTLEVRSETELSRDMENAIHRAMRRLNGVSIVDRDVTSVTLRNFIDVSDSSIYVIMRRLSGTVLHMLDSVFYALLQQREDLLEQVEAKEDDVDIQYWLLLRQLLSAIQNESMREDIGLTSPLHIVGNRTAIKSFEGMADCLEDVAGQVDTLLTANFDLSQQQKERFTAIYEFTHQHIETAVESLIEQDMQTAHDILERRDRLNELQTTFLDTVKDDIKDQEILLAVHKIMWNIERVVEYGAFIAEITINRALEQSDDNEQLIRPQDPSSS